MMCLFNAFMILLFFQCTASQLIPNIEEYISMLNNSRAVSDQCQAQMTSYLNGLLNNQSWAWNILDATPKIPYGILTGNLMETGNYDECLRAKYEGETGRILGKYCGFSVAVVLPIHLTMDDQIYSRSSRSKSVLGDRSLSVRSGLPMEPETGIRVLVTSVCLPDACTPAEMLESLLLNNLEPLIQTIDSVTKCETANDTPEMTNADIGFIIFISIIVALVIICTVYDEIFRDKRKPPHQIFVSFSITRNFQKIISHSANEDRITCLDGLRVFSILWVIMGHRYSILEILPFVNMDYVEIWRRNMYTQYVQGAPTAVDTFLFLTGLLIAMTFLKAYSKPRTKFNIIIYYIHRYLRLTPALAVVYFLHVSVFLHLGDGPFWKYVTERTRENCLNRWASFFFYYQNYLDHNNMCLLHTWYLSMDMQIFIISPLVLLPLVRRRKLMMRAGLPILILLSMVCPFLITYYYETEIFTDDYYKYYYYPTHTRLSPWLIGTFTGAILHIYKNAKLTIHPILNIFIWAVVVSGMVACILTSTDVTYNYDRLSTSLYLSLYRPAWCCGLSWIVYACVKGRGGIFNYILSADIFQTLSKITYAMYLVHITYILHNVARTRYPAHFGDLEVFHSFLGDVLMTIALAFVWCLLFESPIVAVERFIFGGGTRRKEKKTSAHIIQEREVNHRSIEGMKIEDGISVPEPPAIRRHIDPLGLEEEAVIHTYSENRLRESPNNEEDILPEVIIENNSINTNFVDTYPMYSEIIEGNETRPEGSIENYGSVSTENAEPEQNEEDKAILRESEQQEGGQIEPIENQLLQESDAEIDKISSDVDEQNKHEEDNTSLTKLENGNDEIPAEIKSESPIENVENEDQYLTRDVDEQNKHEEDTTSLAKLENENDEILAEAKSESPIENVENKDHYLTPNIDSEVPAENVTTENDEALGNIERNDEKVDDNLEKSTENIEADAKVDDLSEEKQENANESPEGEVKHKQFY